MDFIRNNEIVNKETSSEKKIFSDTFIDKFSEEKKVSKISNELVDSCEELSQKESPVETIFVDKLSDILVSESIRKLLTEVFFNSIYSNYRFFDLSDEEITESVQKVSDFFHLGLPQNVREDWTTGVILGMKQKESDDILCFNREQMKKMGITDREGFDLVMTHEGAHRALQFMEGRYSSRLEELCCDFLAGVCAGLNGMDEEKLIRALEGTTESVSHPNGILRAEAIRAGAQFAREYMAINDEAPSFSECLKRFDKKIDEMSGNLLDTAQNINLKEESIDHTELKPLFVNNREYHLKEAQIDKEWAAWHRKQANEATKKGDLSSAKDHFDKAESYERKAQEHFEAAAKCNE